MKIRRQRNIEALQACFPQFPVLQQYDRNVPYQTRRVVDDFVQQYYIVNGVSVSKFNRYRPPPDMGVKVARNGVLKYGNPAVFDDRRLDLCFDLYHALLGPVGRGPPVTYQDVWASQKKTWKKSPGFPLNAKHVTADDWYNTCSTDMMSRYFKFVDESELGDFLTYWNVFLKDELTSLEKILRGDIREINGAMRVFLLALAIYCHRFNEDFYAHCGGPFYSEVGVSLYGGEWGAYAARRLYVKNRNGSWRRGWSVDIKRMDSTLGHQIYAGIFKLRLARLTGLSAKDRDRFTKLWWQISHGLLVLQDGAVVWLSEAGGNLSGEGSTTVTNTIATTIYVMYAFLSIMGSLEGFDTLVTLGVYGDNLTMLVDDLIIDKFNWSTIVPVWAECGISGTVDEVQPREGSKLDFLSHIALQVGPHVVPYPYGGRHSKAMASVMIPPKEALYDAPLRLTRVLAQRNRFAADAGTSDSMFDLLNGLYTSMLEHYKLTGQYNDPRLQQVMRDDKPAGEILLWMAGAEKSGARNDILIYCDDEEGFSQEGEEKVEEEGETDREGGRCPGSTSEDGRQGWLLGPAAKAAWQG